MFLNFAWLIKTFKTLLSTENVKKIYYKQKCKMLLSSNLPHGKISDFVKFPLFGFTLVIKPINFDFESHWCLI